MGRRSSFSERGLRCSVGGRRDEIGHAGAARRFRGFTTLDEEAAGSPRSLRFEFVLVVRRTAGII